MEEGVWARALWSCIVLDWNVKNDHRPKHIARKKFLMVEFQGSVFH